MELVGMPKWSDDDQKFAREVQEAQHFKIQPLRDKVTPLKQWPPAETERMPTGGGSDDIGDIMWTVPTITIRYPSNIPNTIAHNITAAMAMATPIAHKGALVGAKAVALTVLDLMTTPELLTQAKQYFSTDQQKFDHYDPMLTSTDTPAIHLNDDLMSKMRPLMEPYYYDSGKYPTYLDQLGIHYPDPPTQGIRRPKPGGKSGS
jgi:aminobenzoyl-glutamate utilization protein B